MLCVAGASSSPGKSRKYWLTGLDDVLKVFVGLCRRGDLLGHAAASAVLLSPLLRESAPPLQHHIPATDVAFPLQRLLAPGDDS